MTQSPLNVAVTGALTPIGREVLNILAERAFPLDEIYAVETGAVAGEQVSFGEDDILDIQKLDSFDFAKTQLIIHAGKVTDATRIMKLAVGNKAKMIDLSGAFIHDTDVPLIVAGVNDDDLPKVLLKSVVGVPSAAATLLTLALRPLHTLAYVTQVTATVFDPAVTGGRGAMDEVFNQTKAMFMNSETKNEYYTKRIAFNAIPLVGAERDDGHSEAERTTIIGLNRLYSGAGVAVTHVAVPIFTGMGITVTVQCKNEITPIKAAMQMTGQGGIGVIDDHDDMPTPSEVGGEDLVYIARLRADSSQKNALQFWLCADSIRRGQAMNAVQVAELLIK